MLATSASRDQGPWQSEPAGPPSLIFIALLQEDGAEGCSVHHCYNKLFDVHFTPFLMGLIAKYHILQSD